MCWDAKVGAINPTIDEISVTLLVDQIVLAVEPIAIDAGSCELTPYYDFVYVKGPGLDFTKMLEFEGGEVKSDGILEDKNLIGVH